MNEFNGKNCVIYTRVSSKTQVSRGNGLQSQETSCKEWAKNNEVNIVSVFQDGGISGKYSSREGLDSMIAFLKSENKSYVKIHYVLVDDVDRIIRDVSGWREIKAKIEKSGGAQIHSLKQNIENTPEGNMMQSITMSVKQYERENNARRAVERKRARLMDGYRVSNCPNGYKFTGKGKNKSVVFTDSIHIIKDALEKYADGRFRSMVEFRYYIDDLGLRNANGNYYQKDFYFNLLRKERLLFYAGFVDVPSLGVNMVKGKHEAIISVETMEKILKINEVKFRTRKFSDYDNYVRMPLRNTLFCECCHRPMSGGPSKNKKGDYYYYYRCFNKDCPQNESFNVNVVNSCFEEYLRNLTISDSVLECFKIAMISIYENKDNEIELVNERKKKSIEDITKRIDKLYEITISSDSDEIIKLYQQKLNGLLLEKKKLEGEIISKQKDETNIPELLEYTLPILQNPYKLWMKEDIEIRRLIAGVVIGGKILYNKKSGITTPDISSFYQTNLGFENGISALSEDGGFEPPLPCSKHRFQRCAIDHSANLPGFVVKP